MTDFVTLIQNVIDTHPDQVALTEYPGGEITYSELGNRIKEIQDNWHALGLQKGDHIAICSENSINWVETFLSTVMGGYVAVLLQANAISEDNITSYLDHSDTRLLYTGKELAASVDYSKVRTLQAIFDIESMTVLSERNERSDGKIDTEIRTEEVGISDLSNLCILLYTSGTTGKPKGVALTKESISYYVGYISPPFPYEEGKAHVDILPASHILGLVCAFIIPLCRAMNIVIMKYAPSTPMICSALQHFKPTGFIAVQKIIENIIIDILGKEEYATFIGNSSTSFKEKTYLKNILKKKLLSSFGGIKLLISGGSKAKLDIERFLVNDLEFPYVCGYGLSEYVLVACGRYNPYHFLVGSCGTLYNPSEIRINQLDESNQYGEIQLKGPGLFSGYYKDYESTAHSFTDDGWYKTSDIGRIDKDNTLYVVGRSDNVIVLPNGENIFPEEAEAEMNSSSYIKESILIQRGEILHAIIVPNRKKSNVDGLDADALWKEIDKVTREAGQKLPGFTIINSFELRDEPLERTPKGSLKRYLYSEEIREK